MFKILPSLNARRSLNAAPEVDEKCESKPFGSSGWNHKQSVRKVYRSAQIACESVSEILYITSKGRLPVTSQRARARSAPPR